MRRAAWTRRLSRGAVAIAAAVPVHVLGAFVMTRSGGGGLIAGSVIHALGAGLIAAGTHLLTIPDDKDRQPHIGPALVARALSIVAVLLWVGAIVTALRAGTMPWITVPALACMAGAAIALGLHAAELTQRVYLDELSYSFGQFARVVPALFAFLIFCQVLDLRPYFDPYFFFAFPLLGALLGLAIWLTATLVRLAVRLCSPVYATNPHPRQLEPMAADGGPAKKSGSPDMGLYFGGPDDASPADEGVYTLAPPRHPAAESGLAGQSEAPGQAAASTRPPTRQEDDLVRALLYAWLMVGLGLLLVGAALRDYRLVQMWGFLRTQFLVAEMIAGTGIAFCFGGAMHYLDVASNYRRTTGEPLAWYWRALLVTQKRVLLVGQLAAAALVVEAIGLVIFGADIPGVEL